MAEHGTRSRYNTCTDGPDGGKCDPCKTANREYFKKREQNKNSQKYGSVTKLPTKQKETVQQPAIGPTERGVIEVLANVPAAEKRPDLVASARAMARLQDDPMYAAQQTAAADRLMRLMDQLLKGTEKKSKLSSVRQMSRPGTATG